MNCDITIAFKTGEILSLEGVISFQILDIDGSVSEWLVSNEGISYLSVGGVAEGASK